MEALISLALWAGLIYLIMRIAYGTYATGRGQERGGGVPGRSDRIVWVPPDTDMDPVCGSMVHTEKAKPSVYSGRVYYFCSRECRERFEAAPFLYPEANLSGSVNQSGGAHG